MKSLKFWLGLAVSAGLIVWALSQVDIKGLGQALARTDYRFLALCLPFFWIQYVLRALRWDYLVRPIKRVPYRSLIASTVIGFTGNLVLPVRLGEVVRAVDLGRRESISKTSTLATILLERILDGLAIIPIFLVSAWLLGVWNRESEAISYARAGATAFAAVYIGVLAVVVALALNPQRSLALVNWALKPLPGRLSVKLSRLAAAAVDGLQMLRRPGLLAAALAYTAVIWPIQAVPLYLLAQGVGHPVSLTASYFVVGLICLAIAVPSAPGYVGTMHYAVQFGFGVLLGMSQEQALAVGVLFHGGTFVFTILYCLTFLIRGRVSLFELSKAVENEGSTEGA